MIIPGEQVQRDELLMHPATAATLLGSAQPWSKQPVPFLHMPTGTFHVRTDENFPVGFVMAHHRVWADTFTHKPTRTTFEANGGAPKHERHVWATELTST